MHGTHVCRKHAKVVGGCRCQCRDTRLIEVPCPGGACAASRKWAVLENGHVKVYAEQRLIEEDS